MDPLSALSVAAAVVQFIDFGSTIIASTYAIYKSGKRGDDSNSISTITERLVGLNAQLERSATFSPTSKVDQDIVVLCQQCNKAADTLLDALRELNGANNINLWNSFRLALRTVWSQGEIDALQARLESYRQQISMHIVVGLREQIQSLQKTHDRRDADISVSLQATQQLATQILGVVDSQKRFQTDIIRAINRSNSWTGNSRSKTLDPRRLEPRDLEEFNSGILHILKFQEIGMRERTIADPHASTLGWIFEPSSSNGSGSTFADWLAEDVPFYWIAGKAGSGKSTLMRHLYESHLLTDRLQQWASGDELRILCFYFWNAASDIQMSLEGLVRTLLYQALEQDRQYIPTCFPNRYETRLMFHDEAVFRPALRWEELLDALKAYLQEASKQKKLFLLIDGLDEFGGKPLEIINFVSTLSASRVKVCVSSRPWVAFEDAFGSKPSLRLDNYTRNDIRSYVEENFRANPGFVAREKLDPTYAASIIDNVSEKASGVFLWVSLVVRSLMEGFSGGEHLSDLQARLDELPSDLEQLFLKILNKLSPKQLESSAQFFQMLRLARRQISGLEFSFADEQTPDRIYKMEIAPLPEDKIGARVEILRRRLNECCKGLIEVSTRRGKIDPHGDVSYLHRTVSDFWKKPENKKRLVSLQGDSFNPYARLCLARIAMLKVTPKPDGNSCCEIIPNPDGNSFCKVIPKPDGRSFWNTVVYGIGYAKAAEGRGKTHFPEMFAELGRVADHLSTVEDCNGEEYLGRLMKQRTASYRDPINGLIVSKSPLPSNFLSLAAVLRLKSYIDPHIKSLPQPECSKVCSIALHYAIIPSKHITQLTELTADHLAVINVAEDLTSYQNTDDLVTLLLKHGGDPNLTNPITGRTSWEALWDNYDFPPFSTASAFIEAGADPQALLSHQYKNWILNKNRDGHRIFELCKQAKKRNRGSYLNINLGNILSVRSKSR